MLKLIVSILYQQILVHFGSFYNFSNVTLAIAKLKWCKQWNFCGANHILKKFNTHIKLCLYPCPISIPETPCYYFPHRRLLDIFLQYPFLTKSNLIPFTSLLLHSIWILINISHPIVGAAYDFPYITVITEISKSPYI